MYQQGGPPPGPPPFGPFLPGPPYSIRGQGTFPPTGPVLRGPFSVLPPDINFIHNISRRDDFNRPNSSSLSIDGNTVVPSEGSRHQQILPWKSTPGNNLGDSDQAGEVFLRCLAANEPLPDYLKGNMAYNFAEAMNSANVLKDTVKSDLVFNKFRGRSRSWARSRSRGRSRGRSQSRGRSPGRSSGQSRAKSRGRSKSRARSRSRRSSRGRSKSRAHSRSRQSRSRTRAKSLAKDNTHIRSPSRSHSKKRHARSKSRVRRSKSRSRSHSFEKMRSKDLKMKMSLNDSTSNIGNTDGPEKSLVEELKRFMNSKELEERLPHLKNAIFTMKASKEGKSLQENSSLENDCTVLPHDREGSNFFWLQTETEAMPAHQKTDNLEDEESFLYGKEVTNKQDKSSIAVFPALSQDAQIPSQIPISENLERNEYAKIKDIINSQGPANVRNAISPAETAVNLTMAQMKTPNVQQALESLQSLIKATKEKRERNEASGIFPISDKQRESHVDDKKREKLEKMNKIECLMKELNELMTQDGLSFLMPVIGFYCQKCDEFIGNLGSAENHASAHHNKNPSSKVPFDKKAEQKHDGDRKEPLQPFSSGYKHHQGLDRIIHRNYKDHKDLGKPRSNTDHHHNRGNDRTSMERHGNAAKNEICKERMLITVALGPTPSNFSIKDEKSKELTSSKQPKVEEKNKKKQSKKNGSKDKHNNSDDSEEDKKKSKKKKDKDKKKKKKKRYVLI